MFCFLSNKTSRGAEEADGGAIVIDGWGKGRGDPHQTPHHTLHQVCCYLSDSVTAKGAGGGSLVYFPQAQ